MEKLTLNKKWLIIFLIVSVFLVGLYYLTENVFENNYDLTLQEKNYLKKHAPLIINLEKSPLWIDENLIYLQERFSSKCKVDFILQTSNKGNEIIFSYPKAIYKKDHTEFHQDYIGDYDYQNKASLIGFSSDYTDYRASMDPELIPILKKLFNQSLKDGTMELLLNNLSKVNRSQNAQSKSLGDLNVGTSQLPAITYIKDQNIYGLAIALINDYAQFNNISVNYTIGESDKLNELFPKQLDILVSHSDKLLDYTFFQENYLIASTSDGKVYEDLDLLLKKNVFFYLYNPTDYPGQIIESFEALVNAIEDFPDGYFFMPKSTYRLMNEKLATSHLNLNGITEYEIYYNLLGATNHLVDYISESNADRLMDFSFYAISNERDEKNTYILLLIFMVIAGASVCVYIGVRLILNSNEKHRLNYLFNHDQLTYLLNSHGLKRIFNKDTGSNGLLLLIDLKRFKLVNDLYSYDVGDQILVELSNVFNSLEGMIVAKTASDKFTFIAKSESDLTTVKEAFDLFKHSKAEASKLDLTMCYVEYPKYAEDYDTLTKYLESTLYYAKANNIVNTWLAFDQNMYISFLEEQEIAIEIENALNNKGFTLFYQPQTELYEETTIGAEVLIRWFHESKGTIYPDEFLGVAERNGLMRKLDMYMIKNACKQIKFWQSNHYKKMKISVNMSTYTFESKDMDHELIQIIKESGIDTSWLVIEITEESGFTNIKEASMMMSGIKEHGIRFALDDFGKGYSSLSYLEQLPFDFLKIDKAFIDHIHTHDQSKKLYHLINDLAKLYDIHVIAEGVEHLEQVEIIKSHMATIIQGYYYSKPLSLSDYEARIKQQFK